MIVISGPSGVGKTTYARVISQFFNLTLHEEPSDVPLLQSYFDDPKRWSLACQLNFLVKKAEHYLHATPSTLIDRSLEEDYLFALINYKIGNMSRAEWDLYLRTFRLFDRIVPKPNLTIYLHCNFSTLIQRMVGRGREMELRSSLGYWKQVYDSYQEWASSLDQVNTVFIDVRDYDVQYDEMSRYNLITFLKPHIERVTLSPSLRIQ